MEPVEAADGDGGGPAGPGRAGPAPSQVPGALCQQYLGDVAFGVRRHRRLRLGL